MDNAKLFHLIVLALSSWVNRHQQAITDLLLHMARENTSWGYDRLQIALNLTDEFDGFLRDHRFLIMDRDSKFTEAFRNTLDRADVKPVRCPPRAPRCNAYAERFVRSIKEECLERMIFFGEQSLRRALREYETHYLRERNQQSVGNELLEPTNVVNFSKEPVQRRERLGGLLSYYHREAA